MATKIVSAMTAGTEMKTVSTVTLKLLYTSERILCFMTFGNGNNSEPSNASP
jgi:hypothetical protein